MLGETSLPNRFELAIKEVVCNKIVVYVVISFKKSSIGRFSIKSQCLSLNSMFLTVSFVFLILLIQNVAFRQSYITIFYHLLHYLYVCFDKCGQETILIPNQEWALVWFHHIYMYNIMCLCRLKSHWALRYSRWLIF